MQTSNAVSSQWGNGNQLAVVMSPVMPVWDEGLFFQPMIAPLVDAGYRVIIFDTLSLLTDETNRLRIFRSAGSKYCRRWARSICW
ncbi:hypothetical protein QZH46_04995 [Pseudomonas corrugata]